MIVHPETSHGVFISESDRMVFQQEYQTKTRFFEISDSKGNTRYLSPKFQIPTASQYSKAVE